MIARWLPAALGLLLVAAAWPAVADHAPRELTVDDRTLQDPIQPHGEARQVALQVSVPCQEDERATAWTTAELTEAPPYVTLIAPGMANTTTTVCHDANDTLALTYPVEITLDKRAPAFQTQSLTLEVRVQKNHTNGTVERLGPAQANVTFTPGYFNLYNVRLEQKIGQGGPQEAVTYPILLENFSNGATRFSFELTNPDTLPKGFTAVAPEPLFLGRPETPGEPTTGTVNFQVYTPFHNGYVNEIGAIQLKVTTAYATDTTIEGEASHVSTLTQARGWYVPGPGLIVVLVTLAGAGLAARTSLHRPGT